MRFKAKDTIVTIKPYKPGKPMEELERELGISGSIKLASNENPIGPSPKALDAVSKALTGINRYPDGAGFHLTRKLAERFGVPPESIVLGNGSDDIIALLAHVYLEPGDEALMPLPSFLMYDISVKTAAGISVTVPLKDFALDLDAMADRLSERTRLVFLTNPNNPTGSTFSRSEFAAFLGRMPDDVLVVVDEAYIEFARSPGVYDSLKPPLTDPRIVCLRTFSKAYGLAGIRLGYGVMDPEVAGMLNRIRQPFNVNLLAQAAGVAALDDAAFLEQTLRITHQGLDYLAQELSGLGYRPLPTQSNFFLVDMGVDAETVFEALLQQGVIVRSMKSYGYSTFIRISAGLESENQRFVNALKAWRQPR